MSLDPVALMTQRSPPGGASSRGHNGVFGEANPPSADVARRCPRVMDMFSVSSYSVASGSLAKAGTDTDSRSATAAISLWIGPSVTYAAVPEAVPRQGPESLARGSSGDLLTPGRRGKSRRGKNGQ